VRSSATRHGAPERSAHGGSPPSPAVPSGRWNTLSPTSPRAARPDGSRAPGSVRTLISTWLLTEPELTPAQIRQRLLDEHDAGTSYSTIGHYRRSIINSHYRLNAAFQAGSDDSNQPQSPMTAAFTRTSHASPIASQTGPARSEPQSRADLSGTG